MFPCKLLPIYLPQCDQLGVMYATGRVGLMAQWAGRVDLHFHEGGSYVFPIQSHFYAEGLPWITWLPWHEAHGTGIDVR